MDLIYVLDYRFFQTPDGGVWTSSTYAQPFWNRYLEVFDSVCVVARALPVQQSGLGWRRVDGGRVSFHRIPFYLGPLAYLRNLPSIRKAMRHALKREGAVILRGPSALATCAEAILKREQRAFGFEVVGDPWESFGSDAIGHPLRQWFRMYYSRALQRQCRDAIAVLYVARHLRNRYPPSAAAFSVECSDADLPPEAFACEPREAPLTAPLRVVTIASLDQLYKGVDTLLEAVSACCAQGVAVSLKVVGDGKYAPALKARAAQSDLSGRVEFLGQLPAGQPVREALLQSDLFVLASKTEGMPRALLEAMALGLPCVGSNVGGIPALLEPGTLFQPGDSRALASLLVQFTLDRQFGCEMARRNLTTAQDYREEALAPRRRAFLSHLAGLGQCKLAQ